MTLMSHLSADVTWARFCKYTEVTDTCWNWAGGLSTNGYGQLWGATSAHRFAYETLVEEIPTGAQIDHLCRNRACVNPCHLEPVTPAENVRRGLHGELQTHCVNGHAFDASNTRIDQNGRYEKRSCRACERDRMRVRRAEGK